MTCAWGAQEGAQIRIVYTCRVSMTHTLKTDIPGQRLGDLLRSRSALGRLIWCAAMKRRAGGPAVSAK